MTRVSSTLHITTLHLKAGLTLTTNLYQASPFSNLITTPVHWCGFWVGVMRAQLFFDWLQGRNLLGDDQKFKRGGDAKKGESQISRGRGFFFFINHKFCHILFLFLQILDLKRDP